MSNTRKAAFSTTKILVPIDFSPSSDAALEAASGLAQQFHAAIHLVHVISQTPDFNGSDFFPITSLLEEDKAAIVEGLDARKRQLALRGVAASFSIEESNDIVGSLMRVIQSESADMVVISTHGVSGWRPFIIGSIAEQVIRKVTCTLLLLQSSEYVPAADELATEHAEHSSVPQVFEARSPVAEDSAQRTMDWLADDMAERAQRAERRYDQAHSLFAK